MELPFFTVYSIFYINMVGGVYYKRKFFINSIFVMMLLNRLSAQFVLGLSDYTFQNTFSCQIYSCLQNIKSLKSKVLFKDFSFSQNYGDSWCEQLTLFAFLKFDLFVLNSLFRFPTETVLRCFCMSEIFEIFSSSSSRKIWQLVSNLSHSWIRLIVFLRFMCAGMSPFVNSPFAIACFSLENMQFYTFGEFTGQKLLAIVKCQSIKIQSAVF